jgi:pimeloyl-ACP methyl ester carboxylesterase
VQGVRQVRGENVCEDAWTCSRPPNGEWDRVGIRRVALCDGADGPVVLYLPGMHMNAELPGTDARDDLRLHLALAGHRAWGIDWRTHAVNQFAGEPALRTLAAWDRRVFVDDAAWAVRFVRGAEQAPIVLAGFSYGAGIAYDVAARGDPSVVGLVILDGAPPSGGDRRGVEPAAVGRARALARDGGGRPREPVAGARLPDGGLGAGRDPVDVAGIRRERRALCGARRRERRAGRGPASRDLRPVVARRRAGRGPSPRAPAGAARDGVRRG